jgi:hypothetical protein
VTGGREREDEREGGERRKGERVWDCEGRDSNVSLFVSVARGSEG